MPDLVGVLTKKWKFILGFTLLAVIIALVFVLLSPKKFMSAATALPANSVVADKARLFNSNIETLYSDFGSPDELDRLEGTARLDTIFIATSLDLALAAHYGYDPQKNGVYKAASRLKENTTISRTGYGELKIKVWDTDRIMAASMANLLMEKIQQLHQHLQNESNQLVLQKLQEDHEKKITLFKSFADSGSVNTADAEIMRMKKTALMDQLMQEEKMISQYQLAINTNPQVLMIVENARPSHTPDLPKVVPTLLFTLFGAFVFAFLISLLLYSRKTIS